MRARTLDTPKGRAAWLDTPEGVLPLVEGRAFAGCRTHHPSGASLAYDHPLTNDSAARWITRAKQGNACRVGAIYENGQSYPEITYHQLTVEQVAAIFAERDSKRNLAA